MVVVDIVDVVVLVDQRLLYPRAIRFSLLRIYMVTKEIYLLYLIATRIKKKKLSQERWCIVNHFRLLIDNNDKIVLFF